MCVTCGCGKPGDVRIDGAAHGEHEHILADGTRIVHRHDSAGEHGEAGHAGAHRDHGHDGEQDHHHPDHHGRDGEHDHHHHHHGHNDEHDHHRHHAAAHVAAHAHGPGDVHSHSHNDGHVHARSPSAHAHANVLSVGNAAQLATMRHEQPAELVQLEVAVLDKNRRIAERNRAGFVGSGVLALNVMSSPGAGKTTLLVRTLTDLRAAIPMAVVEGDQETSADADRIRATGAAAVQVNTGAGCHLEADMLARATHALDPAPGSVLFVENVGNLVCPALFDLGEYARIVVLSVTEGDDKPLKYPHMFRSAQLMLLTKTDLLPHVRFDAARAEANARSVNPDIGCLRVSAESGEGLGAWYDWLRAARAQLALRVAS